MTTRNAATIGASIVLAVVFGLLAVWLYLGTYTPLEALSTGYAPGPGIGADVEPVSGSGGRTVFFPAIRHGRSFDTAFTLKNTGRYAVTVSGLEPSAAGPAPWLGARQLLATTSSTASADPKQLLPFRELRLDPGDTAIVVVRFAMRCAGATNASPDVFTDGVRLRYRYLSIFTRTATVRLPFAVTLRCVGGPPATP